MPPRNRSIALCCAGVALIAAIWMLGGTTEEAAPNALSVLGEFRDANGPDLEARPRAPAADRRTSSSESQKPALTTAPASAPEPFSPRSWLEVIERKTGAAASEAQVHVLELDPLPMFLRRIARQELGALEDLARRSGEPLVADGAGKLPLVDSAHARWLCCEYGGLWGCLFLPSGSKRNARLELSPSKELHVSVEDRNTSPRSHVPVSLYELRPAEPRPLYRLLCRGQTESGGARLRFLVESDADADSSALVVRADVPRLKPIEKIVGADELEQGYAKVLLPRGGVIRLRGEPYEDHRIVLEWRTANESSGWDRNGGSLEAAMSPGESLFVASVQPGLVLRARFYDAAMQLLGTSADFAGPTSSNEVVVPHLDQTERPQSLALLGLMLFAGGEAARSRMIGGSFRVLAPGGLCVPWQGVFSSDESGAFSLSVDVSPELLAGAGGTLDLVLLEELVGDERWLASIPVSAGTGSESVNLGQQFFERRRFDVLASGFVTDDRGEPVEGARIEILSGEVEELCGQEGLVRDALFPRATFQSGLHGLFEARGVRLFKPFYLCATKPRYFPREPVECATGSFGVALSLVRAASIEGRVLCDADVDPCSVRLVVRAPQGATSSGSVESDGSFRIDGLPPGTVAFQFGVPGGKPLVVEPIYTIPGEAHSDARLNPADLRTSTRFLDLLLLDEQRAPLANERVFIVCAEATSGLISEETSDAAGRVRVLLSGRSRLWLAGASRRIPARFEEPEKPELIELALEKARAVSLQFKPELELPEAAAGTLFLRCAPPRDVPQTAHAAWWRLAEACEVHWARIIDPGTCTIRIENRAVHECEWVLMRPSGTRASLPSAAWRLEPRASDPAAAISIRADAKGLRKLYAER